MHLNSTARFTLIGTLNMWRNSFYAAFIAYNDANIDLKGMNFRSCLPAILNFLPPLLLFIQCMNSKVM